MSEVEDQGLRADREIDRRIGDVLRMQRLSSRMSLEALGQAVGVTYQQIQKYETGANRISASTLYRLSRILRCELGIFFEGIDGDRTVRSLRPDRKDAKAADALDRIEDPIVKGILRELIGLLKGPKAR